MTDALSEAAAALREATRGLVFTGAGVSVASGIPDFRSREGLWKKYPPEEYATIEAFHRRPEKFWAMNFEIIASLRAVDPNPAHEAVSRLEDLGHVRTVATQNIDGLHQAAGSMEVIELHGGGERLRCLTCDALWPMSEHLEMGEIPSCPECTAILKPDVVYFGEMLPTSAVAKAESAARSCDVCLVIGTSAVVYPAAAIPQLARRGGATILEFNLERTDLTRSGLVDTFVRGPVEETLPRLVSILEKMQ